ncbi:hypothetical protein LshimejAT787_0104770 [Lyophyllum shimeji]|uniref:Uncharacterized protein n=1 Tax=Lyophyllum shimeji TaxID=47721 RepID=A0A9P3UHV7_LYOSH|nr:hypothetical protein LshimejAT787_0104770 [Lyophyllum shimeji]
MTTAPAPTSRASLLSGLRTGGVRSTSSSIPHTAAPGATFNVPRFASQHHSNPFPEEEEDQFVEMPQQSVFNGRAGARAMPMTAAVDGPNNHFAAQMGSRGMNPHSVPFNPSGINPNMVPQPNPMQNQAFQMQMLQLEMMRIQTIQAQQMQAEMLAQAQRQQQQAQMQSQDRRASLGFNPPATAGPLSNSFDLRSATVSAQMRRAHQAEQMKAQLGVGGADQVPMTAALGGKFGSRTTSLNVNGTMSRIASEEHSDSPLPPTPGFTTVISGGTSLGNPASNNIKAGNNPSSKSDSATSWRRGGNNNSVLSGNNRAVSSPTVKVTPPPSEHQRVSPPPLPSAAANKFRPQPLRFSGDTTQPVPTVTIDTSDSNDPDDASSSSSAASNSSPTTPKSSSSNETSLSSREEATRKLYEGLGIGRPASAVSDHQQVSGTAVAVHRVVSQPTRQPRGPPSGADELGPKNFATRIRRKAIGGLGMLMDARERRELVEAF